MPVCHEKKLAFCHIPRTGGVSISNALNLQVIDKHYPASWYRENFPDYFLFATVRNYEDRIRSTFGYKLQPGYEKYGTLDMLVEKVLTKGADNIGLMIKPNEYFLDCEVDYLIRFEHLQDDLNAMLTTLGHKAVKLIPVNSFR